MMTDEQKSRVESSMDKMQFTKETFHAPRQALQRLYSSAPNARSYDNESAKLALETFAGKFCNERLLAWVLEGQAVPDPFVKPTSKEQLVGLIATHKLAPPTWLQLQGFRPAEDLWEEEAAYREGQELERGERDEEDEDGEDDGGEVSEVEEGEYLGFDPNSEEEAGRWVRNIRKGGTQKINRLGKRQRKVFDEYEKGRNKRYVCISQ